MSDKVWTTKASADGNYLSDAPTATTTPTLHNIKNMSYSGSPYLIGIQSRFRRKYFHKALFLVLILIIILLIIGIIVIACYLKFYEPICTTKQCLQSTSDILQSMDRSINPCDDFYRFTCGNWAENHPRPDSSLSHDWFSEKQTKVLRKIRSYLQINGNQSQNDPHPVQQARLMFQACMDTDSMDSLGLEPIIMYLKEYGLPAIPTMLNITQINYNEYKFDWVKTIVTVKKSSGTDIMIGFDIFPDPQNRSINRIVVGAPESESQLPFIDEVQKKLEKMKKHFDIGSSAKPDKDYNDSLESNNTKQTDIQLYTAYVYGIITVFIQHVDPTINIADKNNDIMSVAIQAVEMTRQIAKMTNIAEKLVKTNVSDPLNDILNYSVYELQNKTDSVLGKQNSLPIWEHYMTQMFINLPEVQFNSKSDIILTSRADLKYLQLLVEFINNTSLVDIELLCWWTVVEGLVLHTTSEIRQMHSDYAGALTNIEGGPSRSLYCTDGVKQLLGWAVSYAIADRYFYDVTRLKVVTMLGNILKAFNSLVNDISWMDEETKKSTLEKSFAMKSFIGFPEWILDKDKLEEYYRGLKIDKHHHLANIMGIIKWQTMEKLSKLRTDNNFDWATMPTNVNAFHTFQANTITIPLAILQYPFYDLGLEALNYGAIGTILGHELTHGFDDTGRHFDKNGNMRQWWSNHTIEEYINRTDCFIKQYNSYYLPEVDEYINGELTLSENIADNGGLSEAYRAYQFFVESNGKEPLLPGLENYTHNQLFFISLGNLWCESQTTTSTRWALEDSHSPARIRLRGVISNSREFADAFHCKNAAGIHPKINRCRVW